MSVAHRHLVPRIESVGWIEALVTARLEFAEPALEIIEWRKTILLDRTEIAGENVLLSGRLRVTCIYASLTRGGPPPALGTATPCGRQVSAASGTVLVESGDFSFSTSLAISGARPGMRVKVVDAYATGEMVVPTISTDGLFTAAQEACVVMLSIQLSRLHEVTLRRTHRNKVWRLSGLRLEFAPPEKPELPSHAAPEVDPELQVPPAPEVDPELQPQPASAVEPEAQPQPASAVKLEAQPQPASAVEPEAQPQPARAGKSKVRAESAPSDKPPHRDRPASRNRHRHRRVRSTSNEPEYPIEPARPVSEAERLRVNVCLEAEAWDDEKSGAHPHRSGPPVPPYTWVRRSCRIRGCAGWSGTRK